MPTVAEQNLTLLTDFYELTMGNGYFLNGFYKKQSYFDVFYRSVPDNGGFAIACGLTDIIEYVKNLHFTEADIEFLRGKGIFDEKFLKYLRKFKFTGDIYAVPEGTPVFPYEPIITVKAPPVLHCHQSEPHRACGGRTAGDGIRIPPGSGCFRCGDWGAGCLHWRLRGHGLYSDGRTVRRSGSRHHGPFLGTDVRYGI